jgi:alkanesulfonate monooxygenase SsuD/methylene tetrahydromethanopterin reductase-like flavin-dependent oxidoreductase (luciferase family)
MRFGFGLPTAGAAANGPDVIRFAQRAEALGFESLWSGDHLVLPVGGTSQYPYTADGSFSRPSTEGFLEPYTLLSYVAAATKTIKLGLTVIILPYRNPIVQAKMLACIDVLSGGRLICGVGVGWLEKEFQVLQASYKDRGPVSDEYLEIFKLLWTEDHPEFHGKFYDFDGITMYRRFRSGWGGTAAWPSAAPSAMGMSGIRRARPRSLCSSICLTCGRSPSVLVATRGN